MSFSKNKGTTSFEDNNVVSGITYYYAIGAASVCDDVDVTKTAINSNGIIIKVPAKKVIHN